MFLFSAKNSAGDSAHSKQLPNISKPNQSNKTYIHINNLDTQKQRNKEEKKKEGREINTDSA